MTARAIYPAQAAKGWRPWGALVPFLGIAFVVLSDGILTVALQRVHLVDAKENPVGLCGFAAFLLLPFAALGAIVLAWVRYVERRPFAGIGLAPSRATRTFLCGHLTGVGLASIVVVFIILTGSLIPGAVAPAFRSAAGLAGIALLLPCFALQSSAEELLFRGWMLSAIGEKVGVVAAVAISSAVFTLLHFEVPANWVFVPNVFLFGVFAACWALRSGNVWGVMGWHAGWNWILATGFELRVTGLDAHLPALFVKLTPYGPNHLTGGAQGPEGSLACTLVLLAGIVFTLRRGNRRA